MTITSYRSPEPLYIICLHNHARPDVLFRAWIKDNKIEHAQVTNNKLLLHDRLSFEYFKLFWDHDLDNVLIWDTWCRRHIYLV